MKIKHFKKSIILSVLMLTLIGTTVFASTYNFSFKIRASTVANTPFNLTKGTATLKVNADTYRYSDDVLLSTKGTYCVEVYQKYGLFPVYKVSNLVANGSTNTLNFNVPSSGSYYVKVTVNSCVDWGYLEGSGSIIQ